MAPGLVIQMQNCGLRRHFRTCLGAASESLGGIGESGDPAQRDRRREFIPLGSLMPGLLCL
jgi:hypothetical protein